MQGTLNCPACSRSLFAGDAFCSWCGAPVSDRTAETGVQRRTHVTKTIKASDRQSCSSCLSPLLPTDSFCAICGARQDISEALTVARPADDVPSRLISATQGKYEFISELGHGGMGNVYLARDLTLDRLDAIKVLRPSMLAEEDMVERFRREAKTIANLRHESIVTVYGVGFADGLHYFIMDYIDGTSLSRVLKHVGQLSIQAAEAILYQVGAALSYAHHAQEVVHRDVKPSNIMINRRGRAIVTDFGIAKVSEAQGGGLTRTGVLMGTPEYMSPEQCRESAVTHHTDQYALGAVIFATLTGAPPFTGQWLQVAAAHQTKELPRIQELRPDCPDALAETVERMLAKVATDRWPDIKDALRHLKLRPPAADDPAIVELAELVRETSEIDSAVPPKRVVSSRTPTNLRISSPVEEVETGDVLQLQASMMFADGVERGGVDLQWQSTNPNIATVDPATGRLVAVAEGSVEITAQHGNVMGSIPIGVVPARVTRIDIEPQGVALEIGQSFQLRAQARNKHGERVSRAVTWSSSDTGQLRVSDTGSVKALRPGRGQIIAHCDGTAASTTITVMTGEHAPGDAFHPVSGGHHAPHSGGHYAPATGGQPAGIARIRIPQPPQSIRVSEVFTLTATPVSGDGETINREPNWRVSDAAVVEHLGGGRFLALGHGECEVTAEVDGVTQSVRLRVGSGATEKPKGTVPAWRRPAVVGGVLAVVALGGVGAVVLPGLLSGPDPVTSNGGTGQLLAVAELGVVDARSGNPLAGGVDLEVGQTVGLAADASGADGTPIERSVDWTSSDPAVASVDPFGVVTALAAGAIQVSASVGGITRSIPVRVEEPPPEALAIFLADGRPASDMTVYVGETIALRAAAEGGGGVPLTGAVRWTSRTPEVASIDSDGTLSARRAGATLVAASFDGAGANLLVTVQSPPPAAVEVTIGPVWANLFVNGQAQGEGLRRYNLTLPPGTHQIRAENPRFPAYNTTVTIPLRTQSFRVDIDLERGNQE